ncbi:hypothetical protein SADUNF_Sadunf13G0060000 [Salix dunnii]|uniref:Uncharacterized protein n=1 Tax=Salix dunnii TaxID=1413687 RepID=A0A835MUS7_9ROSI|nr:hypothetical protein SADUNF_Sadunf13G0060000 [Salix dunnii]
MDLFIPNGPLTESKIPPPPFFRPRAFKIWSNRSLGSIVTDNKTNSTLLPEKTLVLGRFSWTGTGSRTGASLGKILAGAILARHRGQYVSKMKALARMPITAIIRGDKSVFESSSPRVKGGGVTINQLVKYRPSVNAWQPSQLQILLILGPSTRQNMFINLLPSCPNTQVKECKDRFVKDYKKRGF